MPERKMIHVKVVFVHVQLMLISLTSCWRATSMCLFIAGNLQVNLFAMFL